MSWFKMAVEAAVLASKPIAEWKRIFADNFGKAGDECMKKADEAFYALLEAQEHEFIGDFVLQRPLALRPPLVKVFLTGEARLKKYPRAPREVAELVRGPLLEAFTGVLLAISNKFFGEKREGIFRPSYWEFNSNAVGYNSTTITTARSASAAMHGILNVIEAFKDLEAKKEAAAYFSKWFNNQLPPSIQDRLQGFLEKGGKAGNHKPSLLSAPIQTKPTQEAVQGEALTPATPGKPKAPKQKKPKTAPTPVVVPVPSGNPQIRINLKGLDIASLPPGPHKVNGSAPTAVETVH